MKQQSNSLRQRNRQRVETKYSKYLLAWAMPGTTEHMQKYQDLIEANASLLSQSNAPSTTTHRVAAAIIEMWYLSPGETKHDAKVKSISATRKRNQRSLTAGTDRRKRKLRTTMMMTVCSDATQAVILRDCARIGQVYNIGFAGVMFVRNAFTKVIMNAITGSEREHLVRRLWFYYETLSTSHINPTPHKNPELKIRTPNCCCIAFCMKRHMCPLAQWMKNHPLQPIMKIARSSKKIATTPTYALTTPIDEKAASSTAHCNINKCAYEAVMWRS